MKIYKVLNLYAFLGGNRYKWDEVAKEAGVILEVTAVELDPEAARLYAERFHNDKVITGDAHEYLLNNYKGFNFIWSSPCCPTHSRVRMSQKNRNTFIDKYPDMKLYEEIILLQHNFKGKYVVENVIPYYEPLIPAKKRGRHLYWTNFNLPNDLGERKLPGTLTNMLNEVGVLCDFHDYNFRNYKGNQPLNKIARNLVDYEAGKTIFQTALGIYKRDNAKQTELF